MSAADEDTLDLVRPRTFGENFFVPDNTPVDVEIGGASHPGKVRENNEDHFAVVRRHRSRELLLSNLKAPGIAFRDDEAYVLLIADGLGGAAFGEVASRLAVETVLELEGQAASWIMRTRGFTEEEARERIEAYTQLIHDTLKLHGQIDPAFAAMGTTLTTAYTTGLHALISHVGDTRAYLLRGAEARQITRDHTLAEELRQAGLRPEDTRGFRHVLTRSFGGEADRVVPEIYSVDLQSGDMLLLSTDGLTDLVSDREIGAIVRENPTPQQACDALVARALDYGGKDNITVVIARYTSRPRVAPAATTV